MRDKASEQPILIVGAGIAGLTTALALAKRGIRSVVFERTGQLQPTGAGIQLSPNALRVLDAVGVLETLRKTAVAAQTVTLRDGRTDKALATVPVADGKGMPYLSLHRADLQSALIDAARGVPLIQIELGHELSGLTTRPDGLAATFKQFSDRAKIERETPLLVAADGVKSRTAALVGLDPATFAGAIAWRARIGGAAAHRFYEQSSGITAWLGPQKHAVAYPIRSGNELNLVLVERTTSEASPDADKLRASFSDWSPRLRGLLDVASDVTPWPIAVTPMSRPWSLMEERVVLIGDAAHAMLPYAAQGAAMAIEDGFVLAELIAGTDDPTGIGKAFEKKRRARVERVMKRAGFHRFVYHLPRPFSVGRNLVMKATPASKLRDSLGWLYDWPLPK